MKQLGDTFASALAFIPNPSSLIPHPYPALEPDGTATACKAVTKWVRLPPAPLTAQLPGSDYILLR